jgi:hypothetical protein
MRAPRLPSPKTVCVPVFHKSQALQCEAAALSSSRLAFCGTGARCSVCDSVSEDPFGAGALFEEIFGVVRTVLDLGVKFALPLFGMSAFEGRLCSADKHIFAGLSAADAMLSSIAHHFALRSRKARSRCQQRLAPAFDWRVFQRVELIWLCQARPATLLQQSCQPCRSIGDFPVRRRLNVLAHTFARETSFNFDY